MELIEELTQKVLNGISFTPAEALGLIRIEEKDALEKLLENAGRITQALHGPKASLCSLVNAKSGLCAEDCAFCAQSARFETGVKRYPFLEPEAIVERAKRAKEIGSHEFCIVTSGARPGAEEFEKLLRAVRRIKSEIEIQVDVSAGFLTVEQARRLKEAGVTRVNHNLQTSPDFYSRIVTTHRYEDRKATLQALKEAGLEICCGVILGMGETPEDRVRAAFELKEWDPECVPINLLDPRPGTPLERRAWLDPFEILKTIAVFRFILPRTVLRLAGGRRVQLGAFQLQALQCGVNGLIIGEYLTTKGSALAEDFANLERAGLDRNGKGEGKNVVIPERFNPESRFLLSQE